MDGGTPAQLRRAGQVRDARGKCVSLLDPYLLHRLGRHDVIPAEPLADIARAIGSGWARTGALIFSVMWPLLFVCLVIAHVDKFGGGFHVQRRELLLWCVLAGVLAVNVAVVWFYSRLARLRRVYRVMLEHVRCPHCGYDLRRLPVDSTDGATVCPECGCAWKPGEDAATREESPEEAGDDQE